jgi:thiol:disulfide interchange protein DsbD
MAEKHRILGVPTVIFLDASGQERAELRLVGFEGPAEFLKRLERAP